MRKRLMLILAFGTAIAVAAAAIAVASNSFKTTVRLGNLELTFSGKVTPKALSKTKLSPITLTVSGKIGTIDGTHPPALKEIVDEIDKNGTVNAKGLAVCKSGQLQAQDTKHAEAICKNAIVGTGSTNVEIAFPEQTPIQVPSKLLAFNGGVKGGVTTIFIHAYISVPTPAAIVTTVKIQKEHKGRYGQHTVASIPLIAGGSGSATSFSLTFHRLFTYKGKKQSYFLAKCPDGHFNATAEAIFYNSTDKLNGSIVVPCQSKG
jgi:hypothetical protein